MQSECWQILNQFDPALSPFHQPEQGESGHSKTSIFNGTHPFYHPAFFHALESSGATSASTGWHPYHLVSHHAEPDSFIPGYLKTHSYGEYIFDWSLADAIERVGIRYYPKWVVQLPFTPIRWATKPLNLPNAESALTFFCKHLAEKQWLTGQWLYIPEDWISIGKRLGGLERHSLSFDWRNEGYRDFTDVLSHYTRKRSKMIRQERNKINNSGFTIERLTGQQITTEVIARFTPFYQRTYLKRSGHSGYLNENFFQQWLSAIKDRVLIVMAQKDQNDIAAALMVFSDDTLYGRYWGSYFDDTLLHFECCFYQGMEFCIEKGLTHFNPGVQGEHKVRRGFTPLLSHSLYFYQHPDLKRQIEQFFYQETCELQEYKQALEERLPFR